MVDKEMYLFQFVQQDAKNQPNSSFTLKCRILASPAPTKSVSGWKTSHVNTWKQRRNEWARVEREGGCPPMPHWGRCKLYSPPLAGSGHPAHERHLQQEELWVAPRSLQRGLRCRRAGWESLPRARGGCARGLSFLHSGTGRPAGMTAASPGAALIAWPPGGQIS